MAHKEFKRRECCPLSCIFGGGRYFPQRYLCSILTLLLVISCYINRVLFLFVVPVISHVTHETENSSLCPPREPFIRPSGNDTALVIYEWKGNSQSLLLGSYYYGYPILQIGLSYLATMYGVKYIFCTSMAISSIIMCIMPMILGWGGDGTVAYYGSFALRIMQGLAEGGVFPNISGIVSGWFPKNEKGTLGYVLFTGAHLGTFIGFFVSGKIIAATGAWRAMFYTFGISSAIFTGLFYTFCHSDFQKHPFITDMEFTFLLENMPTITQEKKKLPLKGIFTSPAFYSLLCSSMCYDFVFYSLQNELPKYMKSMLGFNTDEMSVFTAVPYIFSIICGFLCGLLTDFIERRELLSLTVSRKVFVVIGLMCPASFCLTAVFLACNDIAVVSMFIFAAGSMGFYSAGWTNYCDISPGFSAFLTSIANTCTSCQGFISSILVSAIVGRDPTFWRWQIFMIMVVIYGSIGSTVYVIFGSAERQQWDIDASVATAEAKKLDQKQI